MITVDGGDVNQLRRIVSSGLHSPRSQVADLMELAVKLPGSWND